MQTTLNDNQKQKAKNRSQNDWRELIASWQKSNESPKEFCARRNIHIGTFAHWRGVFKKEKHPQENQFVELTVIPEEENLNQLTIACPTGHKIIFSSALKAEEAKSVFKLLGLIT